MAAVLDDDVAYASPPAGTPKTKWRSNEICIGKRKQGVSSFHSSQYSWIVVF